MLLRIKENHQNGAKNEPKRDNKLIFKWLEHKTSPFSIKIRHREYDKT